MINVSVLITCRDKEKFLDECVNSVLMQSKEPKEIIVVHDECTEPMHHTDVTTIMLRTNLGVQKARHEAFRFSTGELIVFLDGDDVLSPDYLEKMTLVLADGADIAYPDIYLFGKGEKQVVTLTRPVDPDLVAELKKLPIPVSCLMRREVYEKSGGFSNWEVMEDFDFWLKAMVNGYTFKKAETLLWYRQQSDGRNLIDLGKKKAIIAEILGQYTIKDNTITKHA